MKRFALVAISICLATSVTAQSKQQVVDLTAPDGVKLKATYYPAAKPGPGVLLLHACNRDRNSWADLATRLAGQGIHVLALDYRGYGESGGQPFPNLSPEERRRMVDEVWPADVDAAYEYLIAQSGVDRENIGAGGASCGVNQSIHLGRRHSNVKTLALLSGNTNEQGREYLENAAWMPVLVAASEDDGGVLPSMRWLLGFSGNAQNKMLEYQAAGHGADMFAVEKGLEPAIVDWFDLHLRRSPVKRTVASSSSPAPLGPTAAFWKMLSGPGGTARAKQAYEEAKKKNPSVILFPEAEMNGLGYERLQAGRVEDAILLFEMNVAAYPESANVYDSLGDAYVAAGKTDLAQEYARKALQKLATDPSLNEQGRQAIRESAEQKLRAAPGGGGAAGAATTPAGASASQPPPAPPIDVVYRMPVVLTVPGMDRVEVRSKVVYKSVERTEGHNHAQGRHGFDILDDKERSREIIRVTLEFLPQHLRG